MSVIDKILLFFNAVWTNRMIRLFGPVGALGLQLRISQDLILKASKDLGRHPEVLAQDVIEKAEIKLFVVNKGAVS